MLHCASVQGFTICQYVCMLTEAILSIIIMAFVSSLDLSWLMYQMMDHQLPQDPKVARELKLPKDQKVVQILNNQVLQQHR